MLADSFFEQGVTHEVCEDYARNGMTYAVLSDGCTNGGGPRIDTDWGARLMCLAAEKLVHIEDHLEFVLETTRTARSLKDGIPHLSKEAMCATLLALRAVDEFKVLQAIVTGDGFVGGKRRDGTWVIHRIAFVAGGINSFAGPYYLKYGMYGEDADWAGAFGKEYDVQTFTGKLLDSTTVYPDLTKVETYPTEETRQKFWEAVMPMQVERKEINFDAPYELFEFPVEEFELVFIGSDGLEHFFHRTPNKINHPLYFLDVLRTLLDIPGFHPGFMRQQRLWNFRQDRPGTFRRRNWLNGDDVSVGAVYCGN